MRATAAAIALFAPGASAGMFGNDMGANCAQQFGDDAANAQVSIVDADAEDMMSPTHPPPRYFQAHKWGKGNAAGDWTLDPPGAQCAPANPMDSRCHRFIITTYNANCVMTGADYPLLSLDHGYGEAANEDKWVLTGANMGALQACVGSIVSQSTTCLGMNQNHEVATCTCPTETTPSPTVATPSPTDTTQAPTPAPTVTSGQDTPAPTVGTPAPTDASCQDEAAFHIKDCAWCTCHWFREVAERCEKYGNHQGGQKDANNKWHKASQACCACKGPSTQAPTASHLAPFPAVPPQQDGCADWTGPNKDGVTQEYHLGGCPACTCSWMAQNDAGVERCAAYGGYTGAIRPAVGKPYLKGNQGCCVCGGGIRQ